MNRRPLSWIASLAVVAAFIGVGEPAQASCLDDGCTIGLCVDPHRQGTTLGQKIACRGNSGAYVGHAMACHGTTSGAYIGHAMARETVEANNGSNKYTVGAGLILKCSEAILGYGEPSVGGVCDLCYGWMYDTDLACLIEADPPAWFVACKDTDGDAVDETCTVPAFGSAVVTAGSFWDVFVVTVYEGEVLAPRVPDPDILGHISGTVYEE